MIFSTLELSVYEAVKANGPIGTLSLMQKCKGLDSKAQLKSMLNHMVTAGVMKQHQNGLYNVSIALHAENQDKGVFDEADVAKGASDHLRDLPKFESRNASTKKPKAKNQSKQPKPKAKPELNKAIGLPIVGAPAKQPIDHTATSSEGMKFDQGKPRFDLMPPHAELELAKVLTFGAQKYAPGNWKLVADGETRYMAALLRHINQYRRGEKLDGETGLNHLAHAMCCLAFLLELDAGEISDGRGQEGLSGAVCDELTKKPADRVGKYPVGLSASGYTPKNDSAAPAIPPGDE